MLEQEEKKKNNIIHIILASKSERRKEILKREGFDFEVYVPQTEEKDIIGEKYSEELVKGCAREKAEAAYKELVKDGLLAVPVHYRATELCIKVSKLFYEKQETLKSSPYDGSQCFAPTKDEGNAPTTIIVSCDTVVVNDGVIIGKPKDKDDAKKILKSLSGSRHRVISAVCICKNGEYYVDTDTTYVTFRKISDEEIENYIDERKPYDKAGSYGIQDEKFDFVESIEGSMDNVVGFPIEVFKKMLAGLA